MWFVQPEEENSIAEIHISNKNRTKFQIFQLHVLKFIFNKK